MSGTSSLPRIRLSGRSFLAITLTPEAPLTSWLQALDAQLQRSAGFFAGKPVILDLSRVDGETPHLSFLQDALKERGIRVISIENGDPSWPAAAEWHWPASLAGGRPTGETPTTLPEEETPAPPSSTLLVEEPVRSGQHIVWPNGDVVILGTVSSGAEVSAGGSIHVYGALRGRAIAGISGNPEARIFTRQLAAELVAIDGFYATAEEMDAEHNGKPTQVFLSEERLNFRSVA